MEFEKETKRRTERDKNTSLQDEKEVGVVSVVRIILTPIAICMNSMYSLL